MTESEYDHLLDAGPPRARLGEVLNSLPPANEGILVPGAFMRFRRSTFYDVRYRGWDPETGKPVNVEISPDRADGKNPDTLARDIYMVTGLGLNGTIAATAVDVVHYALMLAPYRQMVLTPQKAGDLDSRVAKPTDYVDTCIDVAAVEALGYNTAALLRYVSPFNIPPYPITKLSELIAFQITWLSENPPTEHPFS